MPNVTGNAALDVLIGLFFLYFLLSIVCSALNEAIASALHLRARNLEHGIRSLLTDPQHASAFFDHARVQALFKPAGTFGTKARPPSYIPARVFALTLLDTLAPPPAGVASDDLVARAQAAVDAADSKLPAKVRTLLQDALHEAETKRDAFRPALERSYDEVMDRVGGWYKRRVQVILLVIALALVGSINADSFAIGQRLWKDDALRTAVVAKATQTTSAGCADQTQTASPAQTAGQCIDKVEQLGIPLGWSRKTSPQNGWSDLGKAIGLLVTAFALSLGAPFWFDLLGKVANLRGSGPPQPGHQEKAAAGKG